MSVGLLPEHTASRIVALQSQLNMAALGWLERRRLLTEQQKLWDEAFPGKPYEEIAALAGPVVREPGEPAFLAA